MTGSYEEKRSIISLGPERTGLALEVTRLEEAGQPAGRIFCRITESAIIVDQ